MDYSFLNLKTDFNSAKYDKMHESEYFYNGGICLHPNEKYLQISNSNVNIAFDDSYKVEVIDCNENVLLDITDKVFINEFQDNNGIYQIAFEILPILNDFYFEKVYLKFTHLDSELRLYSSELFITAELEKQSFRLDYKSYFVYKGTNYILANYYQSIRLVGYYNGIEERKESETYTQLNGKVRKSRIIQDFSYTYEIDEINTSIFQRLSIALESDLVYLNGERVTNLDKLDAGERQGKSNFFPATFTIQTENEFYNDEFQIAEPLSIVFLSPLGLYLPFASFEALAEFNRNVNYISGKIKLYDYDTEALVDSYDITILDNYFSFIINSLPNGTYYFNFENLIKSEYDEVVNITDKETWKFTISSGEYDSSEYSNEYFIN